ncbi:hypothetical protein PG997_014029 [Apiospora hydei]|uniref:Uncharacterized protein n=1 Tax=Apiospora hydei TaxID=1337664 RepID=A0ABR1V8R2_9PEZI
MNILIPAHRRKRLLLPLVLNFILIYYWLPQIYQLGDRVRQTGPWSTQYQLEQKSVPTTDELDCLHGSLPQLKDDEFSPTDPIPNRVHFIYGLSNPYNKPGAGRFDFLCYLAVRSAILGLKADKVFLHYTYISEPPSPDPNADPRTNPWIKRLQHDIELVHHTPEELAGLKSRPEASPRGVVLGHEGGNRQGLCNAIMAGHANGTFLQRWLDAYDGVDLSRSGTTTASCCPRRCSSSTRPRCARFRPGRSSGPRGRGTISTGCTPRWEPGEAQYWAAEVKRNGGGLFADQFAYHAWSQMAWDRYLKHLTPEVVRTKDTRFNVMVRRFIGDDV